MGRPVNGGRRLGTATGAIWQWTDPCVCVCVGGGGEGSQASGG